MSIGELREGPLHAAIKDWYARPGDRAEVPYSGFVIDLVRGDELIEVQTAGFHRLKAKLDALLDAHPMTIVHPVCAQRRIVRVDANGEVVAARRSPLRGNVLDVCAELVSFPSLLTHPNLRVDVVLCSEDHVRGPEPVVRRGRRRDPGQRRLTAVIEVVRVETPADLAALLPAALAEPFTTRDVAVTLKLPAVLARQVVYCLRESGVLAATGRTGRAPAYARVLDG